MCSPHTPATGGEERPRANQVYVLTHTPATGGEEKSHRDNQVDGDYLEAMTDKEQWWEFGQDEKCHLILMTIESQDLGLTAHPKDSAC